MAKVRIGRKTGGKPNRKSVVDGRKKPSPGMLGTGMAEKAGRAIVNRKNIIDSNSGF